MTTICFVLFILCVLLTYTSGKHLKSKKAAFMFERNHYLRNFGERDSYTHAKRDYQEGVLGTLFFAGLAGFFLIVLISTV